ncbi:MAG: thermonuclease family protein [Rhodospirillales bacterium]|jgi:endonuclease YncB( thermonuclease family)|nr:thermonuclease family protein [Rhodospirillales bacterium]
MAVWRRLSLTVFFLFAAGSAVAAEPGSSPSSAPPEVIKGEARALAGDVLLIGERIIRLFALRAPRRSVAFGPASRAALHDLIAGKPVTCKAVKEGREGRTVARCRVGGQDLSAAMIRGGWAFPQRRLTAEYDVTEMNARRGERGFWSLIERNRPAHWMWNFFAVMVGALVAGLIGLFAVRHMRAMERRDASLGLASALGGEIRFIGELLDGDADLDNLGGANAATEVLARIEGARTVFDGSAGRLGILPHPIPAHLVRFYGRVQAQVPRMKGLASSKGFFKQKKATGTWRSETLRGEYQEARQVLLAEATALRDDLDKLLGP